MFATMLATRLPSVCNALLNAIILLQTPFYIYGQVVTIGKGLSFYAADLSLIVTLRVTVLTTFVLVVCVTSIPRASEICFPGRGLGDPLQLYHKHPTNAPIRAIFDLQDKWKSLRRESW